MFHQIDSDGELRSYPDPYKNVTEESLQKADELEGILLDRVSKIEVHYLEIGKVLAQFKDEKLYLAKNFPTFAAWCDSPYLSRIGYRSAQRLIQIVNEALPLLERNNAIDVVASIGVGTMGDLLPILRDEDGEQKFVEAAYAVKDLTNRDAKDRIKELRGIDVPLEKETPTVFKAKITRGQTYNKLRVFASNGPDYYECGILNVKLRDYPRFEARFGRFIEVED